MGGIFHDFHTERVRIPGLKKGRGTGGETTIGERPIPHRIFKRLSTGEKTADGKAEANFIRVRMKLRWRSLASGERPSLP